MKHTNDLEEGQNVNTLSEIEEYYKAREQQLLKKLHRQEAALAAAEQTLKRLTENQKAPMDETTEQRTAQEQAFKEKLYRDPLTGIYNRRYYEEVVRKSIGPAGIALMDVDDFKICNDTICDSFISIVNLTCANRLCYSYYCTLFRFNSIHNCGHLIFHCSKCLVCCCIFISCCC